MTPRPYLRLVIVTSACIVCALTACTSPGAGSNSEDRKASDSTTGTSAVLLLDLSKSFVTLTAPDQRALEDVANGMSKLAKDEW